MRAEIGMTRLKAPPNISAIGLPQPDGSTYEVRPGEDRTVDVPEAIAAVLHREHGFEVLALPQYSDEELGDLYARRDELKARLDGLEADQATVAGDGVAAAARLEAVKVRLAAADASLDEVREAERAVEEARSRAALIAEAVAVGMEALSGVARQVAGEESIRETFRQTALSEPLLEEAAENVEAFVAGIVMARDALSDRAAILARLAAECPRVRPPALTLGELGAALQKALADSAVERQAMALSVFTRFAEVLIVGPVYRLESAEARARLAAVKVR